MKKLVVTNISVFGITHAIIDMASVGLVFETNFIGHLSPERFGFFIVIYNLLAFALQSPLGFIVDEIKKPVHFSLAGIALVILSVFFIKIPLFAIILAGLGNALFHVGGAVISLSLVPGKATIPGIYVAPGALGVLAGTLLGKQGLINPWLIAVPLIILCFFIIKIKKPQLISVKTPVKTTKYFELIILLILFSVIARGLLGFVSIFPWRNSVIMIVLAAVAIFAGKFSGGFFADRFGWMRVSMISLIISAVIFCFFPHLWYISLAGIFLFNFTMPVTLTAIANIFTNRPGFAFGLTALALFIGMFPTFSFSLNNKIFIVILFIFSIISLFLGLKLYYRYMSSLNNKN